MTFVRSFDDFTPPARFDSIAFTTALIQEAATAAGAYATIDTKPLTPIDANPAQPAARDLTTSLAVLASGWYRIVWVDSTGAQFITDPVPYPAGAATDLCTLSEVRERRGTRPNDVDQDPLVQRVIASVSAAITEEYEREFTPTAAATRTFEHDPADNGLLSVTPFDLRTITQLRVDVDAASPTTLTSGDYRLGPRPSKHGTYNTLRFRPTMIFTSTIWGITLVEITGAWGFAAIPDNVREAAIVSAVHNLRTSVGQYSIADGAGGETRYERAEIPQAAHDILAPFRRMA